MSGTAQGIQQGVPQFNTLQFVRNLEKSSNSDVIRLSEGNEGTLVVRSKFKEGLVWSKLGNETKRDQIQNNNRASARELVEKLLAEPSINKNNLSQQKTNKLIDRLSEKPITVKLAKQLVLNLQGIDVITAKGLWNSMSLGTDSKLKQAYRFLKGVAKGNLGADIDGSKTESIVKISSGRTTKEQKAVDNMKASKTYKPVINQVPPNDPPPQQEDAPKLTKLSLFQQELIDRVEEQRKKIEEGISNTKQGILTESERNQLVKVLSQVLKEEDPVSTTPSSDDTLSESKINQLVDVLRQITPDGVDDILKDVNENETIETHSDPIIPTESPTSSGDIQTVTSDGLTNDIQENQTQANIQEDQVMTPESDERNYVDLRDPTQPKVFGSGPSKDEINDLASILMGRPTKKDIENLLEQLTH